MRRRDDGVLIPSDSRDFSQRSHGLDVILVSIHTYTACHTHKQYIVSVRLKSRKLRCLSAREHGNQTLPSIRAGPEARVTDDAEDRGISCSLPPCNIQTPSTGDENYTTIREAPLQSHSQQRAKKSTHPTAAYLIVPTDVQDTQDSHKRMKKKEEKEEASQKALGSQHTYIHNKLSPRKL